jgi:hypothetical protein
MGEGTELAVAPAEHRTGERVTSDVAPIDWWLVVPLLACIAALYAVGIFGLYSLTAFLL